MQLAIGEYSYTRTEGRFTDEVVCRDVMGALVLLMNLQLENFTATSGRNPPPREEAPRQPMDIG